MVKQNSLQKSMGFIQKPENTAFILKSRTFSSMLHSGTTSSEISLKMTAVSCSKILVLAETLL